MEKHILDLIKEHEEINKELANIHTEAVCCKGSFKDMEPYSQKWYIARNQITDPLYKRQREISNEVYKLCKCQVELKHPDKIFGARVVTGYRGAFESCSCNILTEIVLSESLQKGIITTPFKFNLDGTSELTKEKHEYSIIRKDDKVYWIFGTKDSLSYYL